MIPRVRQISDFLRQQRIVLTPEQREQSRRMWLRFRVARAVPGSVVLTPQQQAAKDLADLLMAKYPDMHEACDALDDAIGRDMAIIASDNSVEAVKTAADRLELHRQAIEFVCAAHARAGTIPRVPWDD
jgi:hypothetical protein